MRATRRGAITIAVLLLGLPALRVQAQSQTIFTSQTPQQVNQSDGASGSYELGTVFQSSIAGQITAIRFWKDSRESGSHTGRIWSTSGQILASVSFSNESGSGWQTQTLPSALSISPNVRYIVTVNTGNTYYVASEYGLASQVKNQHLSTVVGQNGVFGQIGRFPTASWNASNYFRDVVFVPSASGGHYTISGGISGNGGNGATMVLSGAITARTTANSSGAYSFTGVASGSYAVTPSNSGFSFNPTVASVTVNGGNATVPTFTATAASGAFSISGTISGSGGNGATVTLSGAASASTTANGSGAYSFSGLGSGTYTVSPSSSSATFSPSSQSVTLNGANQTGVNFSGATRSGNAAIISWTNVHQTIDGFGASTYAENRPLTSSQVTLLFSTLGFSLLRTGVPIDGSCTSVSSACAGEVSDMQAAAALGVRVWSAPWSPPASMKSNGSTVCNTGSGGSGLSSGSYAAYAKYLSNYVSSLSSLYSISLYALSVQNEPDYCPSTYAGANWSAGNFDTFIKSNLGPTLAANGQSSVRIMMPESSLWSSFTSEAGTCMGDSACSKYVGINAWHDYDAASSITNPYSSLGKGFWETEASAGSGFGPSLCGGCWDPSMADALLWANIIDNRMAVSNANAWNYWWFIDYNGDNEGMISTSGATSKRLYMMANYAKFVRPGWVRIDATHTPVSGVTVSAYKDPSTGAFAIVVTNQNSSSASLTFSLSGFTASSVTPWVTSASLNLAQQPSISASGGAFTAALPGSSVTTFVGADGN